MYKAIVCYDGTRYFGWQKTRSGPSIQEELEKAILQIANEKTFPEAASRTDRGVHARGQIVQFSLNKSIHPEALLKALNAVLPHDIRVLKIEFAQFHPTLDATGKEYHYRIWQGTAHNPMLRLYSWHLHVSLNFEAIQQAAESLLGRHDFSAFANEKEKDPFCTLYAIDVDQDRFRIQGDRFLYKMVRNLVGTLVYVGCGKIPQDSISSILEGKDRKKAGVTAPAHGLYLHQVFYTPFNELQT